MNVWPKQSRITTLRFLGCSFVSIYLQFCESALRGRRKLCLPNIIAVDGPQNQ